LQVRVSVPQFPQLALEVWPGVQTGVPLHEQLPQVQLLEQDWLP